MADLTSSIAVASLIVWIAVVLVCIVLLAVRSVRRYRKRKFLERELPFRQFNP